MATIQNRSRITVTVKNRPDVTRFFSYNALDKVEGYVGELRSKGFRPKAEQGDDTWEVRSREKGYPTQNITCPSRKEAEALVKKLESERSTGLIRDYTKAHQVTSSCATCGSSKARALASLSTRSSLGWKSNRA